MDRRLTAILYADVAGYSRLTGVDEEGTHQQLNAGLDHLAATIEQAGGRVVHEAGDAILAEFKSTIAALQCATEFQRAMAARDISIEDEKKLAFRIGINLGEVIDDRDDIYGDGVNVAARLEGLASTGGVCISRAVFDQVQDKIDLGYEYLGEQTVKNIAKPVRAYKVLLDPGDAGKIPDDKYSSNESIRWPVALGLAVLLIFGGGAYWWKNSQPEFTSAKIDRMALALPEQPSIAVLPFDNMSGDPTQEYFADGMADDLLTELSKLSGLFVISRNSSFTYKGKAVKISQVAEELGVRYVLEGSVRKAGKQVRINAQLIDAVSGFHVWAEKFDGPLTDVFALQDKVVGDIVEALAVELTGNATARAGNETESPEAYEALLQGMEHFHRQTPEDSLKAIDFFKKAVAIDSGYSRGYAGLANTYWIIADFVWADRLGLDWQNTFDNAKKYLKLALRQPTGQAFRVSAELMLLVGEHDTALAEINKAIRLNPNDPENRRIRAWILVVSGQQKQAEAEIRIAMRLNPAYRPDYLRVLGYALFHQEQYAKAAEVLQRAAEGQPDYEFTYRLMASVLGHLGKIDEAKSVVDTYNAIVDGSDLTVQEVGRWQIWKNPADLERFRTGLRKAGVPEGAAPTTAGIDFNTLLIKTDDQFDVTGVAKIDAITAKALFDRGVVFVDVRSEAAFKSGHIANAVNLHLSNKLDETTLSEVIKKQDEVVFYCQGKSCYLSPTASAKAAAWGFSGVYYFAGGISDWRNANYPFTAK